MKKLLLGLSIALMACSCKQENKPAVAAPAAAAVRNQTLYYTLNGLPFAKADTMVNDFLKNEGVYDKDTKANFWFSKKAMDAMYDILDKEGADGVRIYFAKNADGKFELVMVSTKELASGKHQDYFKHKSPLLTDRIMQGESDHGTGGNWNAGALLYNANTVCSDKECDANDPSFVKCEDARLRVNTFGSDPVKDTINTRSEWYGMELVKKIHDRLQANSNLDGVRIYINRREKPDAEGKFRHGFIMVTTKKSGSVHEDYYDCAKSLYFITANRDTDDNGEQCPNSCDGDTWD